MPKTASPFSLFNSSTRAFVSINLRSDPCHLSANSLETPTAASSCIRKVVKSCFLPNMVETLGLARSISINNAIMGKSSRMDLCWVYKQMNSKQIINKRDEKDLYMMSLRTNETKIHLRTPWIACFHSFSELQFVTCCFLVRTCIAPRHWPASKTHPLVNQCFWQRDLYGWGSKKGAWKILLAKGIRIDQNLEKYKANLKVCRCAFAERYETKAWWSKIKWFWFRHTAYHVHSKTNQNWRNHVTQAPTQLWCEDPINQTSYVLPFCHASFETSAWRPAIPDRG